MLLNLEWVEDFSEEAFFVNQTNLFILDWIKQDHLWNKQSVLIGPKKSGKTHLAHIWNKFANAHFVNSANEIDYSVNMIIDMSNNSKKLSEEHIFNILFNSAYTDKKILWLFENINTIDNLIPDIRSRFNAITQINIPKPDDSICIAIMKKLFHDFGLDAHDDVLQFLIRRIKRSYLDIYETVKKIHIQCAEQKRGLSVIFASSILDRYEESVTN